MYYPLPYAYDALEPHFDKMTMEIHHTKHHQTYVNNTNTALEAFPEMANLDIDDLIAQLDKFPADKRTFIRNNAGGHSNHSMFWKGLKTGTTLQGDLKAAIERDFGSVEAFQAEFESRRNPFRFRLGLAGAERRQTGCGFKPPTWTAR